MNEKLKNFGWTGWAVVGLIVILVVGGIIAANSVNQGLGGEIGSGEGDELLDASDDEVYNVSVNDGMVSDEEDDGSMTEELPQSGAVGQREFEY